MNQLDQKWMQVAIGEAKKAAKKLEVPVGAVLVQEQKIVARAHNLRETKNNPTGHAELLVIAKASQKLKSWRLLKTTLYVTLEPCAMCFGAIVLARVKRVVFGAYDKKAGVCGSATDFTQLKYFNHHPQVEGGVMGKECGHLLSEFFKQLRLSKGPK